MPFFEKKVVSLCRLFKRTINMTIEDIQALIHGDETRTLELKKTTGELKDGIRSVCAFLNTAGGWLFFGIAPTTLKILGQEVTDNTRKEIAREIAKLEPLIDLPIEYIEVPDRPDFQVIAIHVDAAGYWSTPYTYDSKPYIRIESTTVVMPRDMFEDRLMRSKGNRYKWEDQVCEGITIADLEEQRIRGGVRLGVERGRMPTSSLMETTESLVEKLKLTTSDGKLKNAAAALFLHDTSQFPQFLLRMARFRGTDKNEFIDNQRAYGNFFTLLDAGMAFFFKHLSISGKIVGFTREEKLEIPAEALREALTNALCHRMFHNTSSSVGIAIYDDRVEIENTGHLPDELTVETIKQSHHSFPQNPTIADVLFKTTFLENWGSGVGRMVDACKKANLPEPEFNQNAAFVWVTFKRSTIQAYNPTTPQPHNPTSSSLNPTTSKDNRAQKLKTFFSIIGENGANLKMLMEGMHLRDRKSFVNNYINPNLSEGYIAMLYPEIPNHPMQSYYLTKKGRELLEHL